MIEIRKGNALFMVELEKTRAYYQTHELCNCSCCRNLYAQIRETAPALTAFLASFGVDITRPDECGYIEMQDYIDYLFVGYTVTGRMQSTDAFAIEIDGLQVTASPSDDPTEWFPNGQTEPYFLISISGLSLPWVLDEPFPVSETPKEQRKSRKELQDAKYAKDAVKTWVEMFHGKNKRLAKRGRPLVTKEAHMEALYKKFRPRKWESILICAMVLLGFILYQVFGEFAYGWTERIIFTVFYFGMMIPFARFNNRLFRIYRGILQECKETGIDIFEYQKRMEA